jgi:hypothetical protein
LTSAGGTPLTSIDALYEVLDGEGGQIEFTVMRADEELKVVVSFD